jgi:hypothetical protein
MTECTSSCPNLLSLLCVTPMVRGKELTPRRCYEMVQSPRSHVIFQDVHQINRCLVSRLYPSRDVEWETIIPRKGLVSPSPSLLLEENVEQKLINSHNQLQLILDVLGTPTIDEFYAITSRRSKEYIRSLAFRKKIPFKQLYPKASDEAIDFLDHTLTCMSFSYSSLCSPTPLFPLCCHYTVSFPPATSRLLPPLYSAWLSRVRADLQSTQERGSP